MSPEVKIPFIIPELSEGTPHEKREFLGNLHVSLNTMRDEIASLKNATYQGHRTILNDPDGLHGLTMSSINRNLDVIWGLLNESQHQAKVLQVRIEK